MAITPPSPDQARLWQQLMGLSEIREADQPGYTRRLFSDPYQRSRTWVASRMSEAGLSVQTDPAGNLVGTLPGVEPDLPAIVIGSHTDTVAGGGRFDGMVGVVGSIEVARLLGRDALRHPLWVVDFLGEEPNRFGLSCVGSRAVSGELTQAQLDLSDGEDGTLAAALERTGVNLQDLSGARWNPGRLHCFLELHIEQGARLETAGLQLAVVSAIAGIHRGQITWTGRPDHAGTTPMLARRDALAAAAEGILLAESLAREGGLGVGTVGRVEVSPGASNVIPGAAKAWFEFRSADGGWLADRQRAFELGLEALACKRQITVALEWATAESPTECHLEVRRRLGEVLEELGHASFELASGASHDAAHLGHICPMGMIFVPSQAGRSHCPEEWTQPEDVAVGVSALLAAVLRLDRADLI